ncbi:hypothetical protein QJS04_geneDACA013573 [Acorus gramineus]|uniref:Late embryogenesis abundant protein LEA-2 subgroup domain-containing protein n=1 Tax=Acorus gramineus TaxID=55184 RepID=A0AAV9AGY5_ACOGR|nr:hypothetical protein QJS04_geneDACA013573 [Acorus gramineus]
MDPQTPHPLELAKTHHSHNEGNNHLGLCLGSFFCFLVSFLFIGVLIIAALAIFIVFDVRPKKPTFALQAIRLNTFKLDANSSDGVFVSSELSLSLVACNPNKFGIHYNASRLDVVYEGIDAGVIMIHRFYQPANSSNQRLCMHVVFENLNLSQDGGLLLKIPSNGTVVEFRIVGNVLAQAQVLNVLLPRIKVSQNFGGNSNYCLPCVVKFFYRPFWLL